MYYEILPVLNDIARAIEGIERHLKHFVEKDSVYCLACGKKFVGVDLRWHKMNNEILENGGMPENYCICQECIESRLQNDFDETCNNALGFSSDETEKK